MIKNLVKKFSASLTAAAMFTTMITAAAFAADRDGVDWGKSVVRATGLAAGKDNASSKGIKRAQAKRAAMMDAQRNLAEIVEGVQVTSESSMKDLMLDYDIVKTRVEATIKNMREVSEKYNADDTCEVVVEMPLFGDNKSLAAAAFLPFKNETREPFPQPSTANVNSGAATLVNGAYSNGSQYTGLVIDCSGMNLNPVMSPVIKNDAGQSIYGHKNLDIDKVIEFGMASYAENSYDEISRDRAGDNPLVVKAVKLEGFNANPVVAVNDADRILIANQSDQFLDNLAVVFVR